MQWFPLAGRYRPCRAARIFCRIGLSITLLVTLGILLSYLDARVTDAVKANAEYPALLEYIVASLGISLLGGWLIDVAWKDAKKQK